MHLHGPDVLAELLLHVLHAELGGEVEPLGQQVVVVVHLPEAEDQLPDALLGAARPGHCHDPRAPGGAARHEAAVVVVRRPPLVGHGGLPQGRGRPCGVPLAQALVTRLTSWLHFS